MPTFQPEELLDLAVAISRKLGASDEDALTVGKHLVDANLAGHDSHGVIRLVQYRRHVDEGKIVPDATVETVRETGTTALLDGNKAWGQVVARRAVEVALAKAREQRVAAVSVRNCYHIGRVGVYPRMAAREGFIAQLHANGHGIARVAPWGGTEPRLATNPLAVAIPTRSSPVVVDITTSVVAEGKIRVARNASRSIPEGWVIDRKGRPTTDPADLYAGGSLLPLGGREGHKGYGLSVVVDVLGGVLSGAGCGFLTEEIGNGLFLQLTDPAAFVEREMFLDRVEEFLAYLRSSAPRDGIEEILVPGEPEERTTERRRREGIEVDDVTWSELRELARSLGLALSSP